MCCPTSGWACSIFPPPNLPTSDISDESIGMASKLLAQTLLTATKAATKAAGQGAKGGIKNAVRGETKMLAQNLLKQARSGLMKSSFVAPNTSSLYEGSVMPVASLMPVASKFPAYCVCAENPRAQKAFDGKRFYFCDKCAPKGMGVGDFKIQYETNVQPLSERVSRMPQFLRGFNFGKGSHGSRASSRAPSRGRNMSRRASSRSSSKASRRASGGRSKSKGNKE